MSSYHHTQQSMSSVNLQNKGSYSYTSDATLLSLLNWRLASLRGTEDEQLDYEPHLYAEEGDSDCISELDSIIITDEDSLEKTLKDLDSKFMQLAYICMPPQTED